MTANKNINVEVFRFDPSQDSEPSFQSYLVPFQEGMSAMDTLDYIYQNLDSTLAYYDHAGCALGICGRCTARINGNPGLLCQTPVTGDLKLEPLSQAKVLKDLVCVKPKKEAQAADKNEMELEKEPDINDVPIIVRREIEALIAAPLIKAYMDEFGQEKALAVARKVIAELAMDSGKLLAAFAGGNTMEHLNRALPLFSQGGALEIEVVETGQTEAKVNITRCRYAEMYREYGLEDMGFLLSCGRDFDLIEGFNSQIKLKRTQTIMQGADYCDFCFVNEG